jgi:putative Mn2+ efflux pump MntP
LSPSYLFLNLITEVLQLTQNISLDSTSCSFVHVLKALKEGHATCLDFGRVVQTLLILSSFKVCVILLFFLVFFYFSKFPKNISHWGSQLLHFVRLVYVFKGLRTSIFLSTRNWNCKKPWRTKNSSPRRWRLKKN